MKEWLWASVQFGLSTHNTLLFWMLHVRDNVEIYVTEPEQGKLLLCAINNFYKRLCIAFILDSSVEVNWLFALVQIRCIQMINFKSKVHLIN